MTDPGQRPARKETQPYRAAVAQPYASEIIESSHEEALYAFGEMGLFTLMWRPIDFTNGLVDHCSTCWGAGGNNPTSVAGRQAKAFQQPTKRECLDCFGTTYEGGYRAQVMRPMLMADRNSEIDEETQGVVTTDTISFETTSDFTFHRGDYLFRFDGTRFQCEEKNEAIVRTGFSPPLTVDSFSGVSVAHLEEHTTVAHRIPPGPEVVKPMLSVSGPFTVTSLAEYDTVRPKGYL